MQHSPGKRLKAMIHAPRILALPGVFDGFSTRLVRHAGYTAAFITGSGVSESRLGQVDVEESVVVLRSYTRAIDCLGDHQPSLEMAIVYFHLSEGASVMTARGLVWRASPASSAGELRGLAATVTTPSEARASQHSR